MTAIRGSLLILPVYLLLLLPLQLIDPCLHFPHPVFGISYCRTLFFKRRVWNIAVFFKIFLTNLQVIFFNHFFTGRNLTFQACNLRQHLCFVNGLPPLSRNGIPNFF